MSTVHQDRLPVYPGRVKLVPTGTTNVYDMTLADGATQAGTAWSKGVMDEFLAASGTTGGTATALTLSQPGFTLFDGALVRIKLHTAMGSNASLNVNGTGAKRIENAYRVNTPGGYAAGMWLDLVYSSTYGVYVLVSSAEKANPMSGMKIMLPTSTVQASFALSTAPKVGVYIYVNPLPTWHPVTNFIEASASFTYVEWLNATNGIRTAFQIRYTGTTFYVTATHSELQGKPAYLFII